MASLTRRCEFEQMTGESGGQEVWRAAAQGVADRIRLEWVSNGTSTTEVSPAAGRSRNHEQTPLTAA